MVLLVMNVELNPLLEFVINAHNVLIMIYVKNVKLKQTIPKIISSIKYSILQTVNLKLMPITDINGINAFNHPLEEDIGYSDCIEEIS
jgi:hypothetical protein